MSRRLIGFLGVAGVVADVLHNYPGAPGGPGGFPGAPMTPGAFPGAPGAPQAAPVAPSPIAAPAQQMQPGVMDTGARPGVGGDYWPEGDITKMQMGGSFHILWPGISTVQLPANLAQCWKWDRAKDNNPRSATFGQEVDYIYLDFDKTNPLVVVAGRPEDIGQPLTATISGHPRGRGKKDNPTTPFVADLALMYAISLGAQDRPTGPTLVEAQRALAGAVNRYAGAKIRIEHGLSGFCSTTKVKRMLLGFQPGTQTPIFGDDPTGAKGCGEGYYNDDYKNRQPSGTRPEDLFHREIQCQKQVGVNGNVPILCGAIVRGWPRIERFLPPLGQ